MIDDASPSGRPARLRRRRGRLLIPACAVAIIMAALPRFSAPEDVRPATPEPAERPASASPRPAVAAEPKRYAWMLDPTPAMGSGTLPLGRHAPLGPAFETGSAQPAATVALANNAPVAKPQPAPPAMRLVQTVPLPMPRPADLQSPQEGPRLAQRPGPSRTRVAAVADTEADRSFFETVFGAKPSAEPTLAYAAIDRSTIGNEPRRLLGPVQTPSAGTAIYDISARLVTLPNGERLEAHSGLGSSMDDPRFVHLKMRGATPPGTYDLTEREAIFHGVRALRLNPVGGPGAIHGRVGLLAHTYMLGPSGASNGCVVFKNYNRFLQAYLRGEIRRLVVVAGRGQDAFPAIADRLFGRSSR